MQSGNTFCSLLPCMACCEGCAIATRECGRGCNECTKCCGNERYEHLRPTNRDYLKIDLSYKYKSSRKLDESNAFHQILKQHNYEIGFKKTPYKPKLGIIEIEKPIYIIQPQVISHQPQTVPIQSLPFGQISEGVITQKPAVTPVTLQASQQQQQIAQSVKLNRKLVKETYPNGCVYEGEQKNGKRHGHGKFTHPSGKYYEGNWRKHKMFGEGRFFSETGQLLYDGEWEDDDFHGRGIEFNEDVQQTDQINYRNLDTAERFWVSYEGEFKEGKKHGSGIMIFVNKDQFNGQFVNNKANGYGEFMTNQEKIKGMWQNNILFV